MTIRKSEGAPWVHCWGGLSGIPCFSLSLSLGAGARPPQPIVLQSVGWAEIKPHLGGHWEYTQRLVTDQFELSNALTSNRMLPDCGFERLSTLGLKQQRVAMTLLGEVRRQKMDRKSPFFTDTPL